METNLFGKCPYVTTQKLLSGKWTMYIMFLLSKGELRFNELQRSIPEKLTHTTLSRQLKKLEEENLIIRKEYHQVPPKVEYSLSEVGKDFIPVLKALHTFGANYIDHLNQ